MTHVSMTKLEKLDALGTLTERAHLSIKQYILEGHLDVEARLTEDFFARRLGISKSPVREALNTLQGEGLVRIEPRRGAFLRRFTAKEIADLYQLREALEVFAVATTDITAEFVQELENSVDRTCRFLAENDKVHYIEEDVHFHDWIMKGTGNTELQRVFANIQNKLWLCRLQTYRLTSPDTPESHREVAWALRERDRAKAQHVMQRHIRLVRDALLASMEGQEAEKMATMELMSAD